eukprot:8573701-Prorocentrum_lima.AAC.1
MPTEWPEWEEAEDADGGGPDTCGSAQEPPLAGLMWKHHNNPEWVSQPDVGAKRLSNARAPSWKRALAYKDTTQLLQGMEQFRKEAQGGAVPHPSWNEELLYTPRGTPLHTGKEAGFEKHSCLYEAVAMYLGMRAEDKPVSTLRFHCAEYLRAENNGAWQRWDE